MPTNVLWALGLDGRAYSLALNDDAKVWRLNTVENVRSPHLAASTLYSMRCIQVKLRRLSAGLFSVWAVGSDFNLYVFVHASDVPVRVQEETWENQRWTPVFGFTSKLFPTDRARWSTADGSSVRRPETVLLPSQGWRWESPWSVDANPLLFDKNASGAFALTEGTVSV